MKRGREAKQNEQTRQGRMLAAAAATAAAGEGRWLSCKIIEVTSLETLFRFDFCASIHGKCLPFSSNQR